MLSVNQKIRNIRRHEFSIDTPAHNRDLADLLTLAQKAFIEDDTKRIWDNSLHVDAEDEKITIWWEEETE